MSKIIDQQKPFIHAMRGVAGVPCSLLTVLKSRRVHQSLAVSAMMAAAVIGSPTAFAQDSNESDAGSGEGSCPDDGACVSSESVGSDDPIETTDGEVPRDQGTCADNGGASTGLESEETEAGVGSIEPRPVNWETGEKWETETDLVVRLPGADYRFTREYTSDPTKALNPYDTGDTLPACANSTKISANVGSGWGWSNLRAATGVITWEYRPGATGWHVGASIKKADITLYRPARKPKYVSGKPVGQEIGADGPGNQFGGGPFVIDQDGFGGVEPEPCDGLPSAVQYGEPGRWSQSFDMAEGVGWITKDTDENENFRLYVDSTPDAKDLPDEILFNGLNTTWNDADMADAWIELKWEGNRVVRADVYRPSATGDILTQTVQYYHLVDNGTELEVKYHDGTAYTTLDIPSTSTPVDPSEDLGTEGDLVMVVRSSANDPGNGSTDWRRQITQYRYHNNIPALTSGDIRLRTEGGFHQLKSVFQPQQVEHMAEARLSSGTPTDVTALNEAIKILELHDDDDFGGASSVDVYEVANKIVTYDAISDRVERQFVQSGNCGCGSGGATNGVLFDYKWLAWTKDYGGATDNNGTSLHMREYKVDGFTAWPTSVYRSHMTDMIYLQNQPHVLAEALVAGDVPTGPTTNAWVKARTYNSSRAVTQISTPSAHTTYTPAIGSADPEMSASTLKGLVSQFTYDGENAGVIKRGVNGDTDIVLKRTYVDSSVKSRNRLIAKIEAPRESMVLAAFPIAPVLLETTEFDYGFEGGTSKLDWKRSRVEREAGGSSGENGPAGAVQWAEYWEFYDDKGQLIVTLDPGGVADRYEYDARTGTLLKVTRNYNVASVASIPEIRLPTGAFELANPFTGLSSTSNTLITEYERDMMGRVTKVTRPGGVESWTVRGLDTDATKTGILYYAVLSMPHQVESPGEYNGPASKRLMDAASKTIRSEQWDIEDDASYDPGIDTYAGNDSIMDTTELARSVVNHDSSGQMSSTTRWWDIANDFSMTTSYEYDAFGRVKSVTDAEETITQNSYDVLDRRIKTEVGTTASNLVTLAEYFYDGDPAAGTPAQGVGNGNLTAVKLDDGENTRITRMYYDDRDRQIATIAPDAPMSLTRYDNLDRPIEEAVFPEQTGPTFPSLSNMMTAAGATIGVNPAGISGNRSWYTKTSYSQRGYVWKQQTAIDATSATPEYLSSYSWFDIEGNLLASWGPNSPMIIREYDEYDRVDKTFVSDRLGEVTGTLNYESATSTVGDTILEQSEYKYDYTNGGVTEMIIARQRAHDATGTGELDDSTSVTSYVGQVYDDALRRVGTVNFGTNKSDFATGTSTAPTMSNFDTLDKLRLETDVLFSWNAFNARGLVEDVHGIQKGTGESDLITTRYVYDDLNRTVAVIENYDNASLAWDDSEFEKRYTVSGLDHAKQAEDRVTSFVYDKVNKVTKRVAHMANDPAYPTVEDAQITEYVYGTIATASPGVMDSMVTSNNLLAEVRYPNEDTGEAAGVLNYKLIVKYAYNRLGELRGITDQNQTIRTFERDKQGRVLADAVESPGTYSVSGSTRNVDGAIRRIEYAYDDLGRMTSGTSRDTKFSSGTVQDQVEFEYTPLWQVASVAQQHDGVVGVSSPKVEYTYSNADANGAADNYSRLIKQVYPTGSDTIQYDYDTGEIDDRLSRVNHIDVYGQGGASYADLVKYDRIGMGMMATTSIDPVSISHDVVLDRTKNHNGTSTAGAYPAFDRFGRVASHMWVRSDFGPHASSTAYGNQPAYMEIGHTYDRASNRLSYTDDREGSSLNNRNRAFTYDRLNRLTEELRTPISGSVYNHASSEWDLDMLGNWTSKTDDADHDGAFNDDEGVNYRDERQHNMANEIQSGLQYDQKLYSSGVNPTFTDHHYDDNGNMTDERKGQTLATAPALMDGQVHTYDAWNRLVKTEFVTSSGTTTISENTYNALGWRTSKAFDTSTGAFDGIDQKRVYSYGADWRMIEEHIDTDVSTNSDSAGDADDDTDWISQQFWGIRYIDDAVGKRVDRDADGDWDDSECSNWYQLTDSQFSVGLVLNDEGKIHERVDYNAYGVARYHPAGDLSPDGVLDFFDVSLVKTGNIGDTDYNVDLDFDLNGVIDFFDVSDFLSFHGSGTGLPAGWISDPSSTTGPDNSIGYAGYMFNHEREDYSVRFRMYNPDLGRWMQKDPIGYAGGGNLYCYVKSNPLAATDPMGLFKLQFDDTMSVNDRKRIRDAVASACAMAKRLNDELDKIRESLSDCEKECLKDQFDELERDLTEFSDRCDDNTSVVNFTQRKIKKGVEAETTGTFRLILSKRIRGRRTLVPNVDFPATTTFNNRTGTDWNTNNDSQLTRLLFHELLHSVQNPKGDQDGTGKLNDPHNIDQANGRPLDGIIPMTNAINAARRECK